METSLSTAIHFLQPAHTRKDYIDTSCTFLIKGFPLPSPGFIDEEFDLTSTSLSTSSQESLREGNASPPCQHSFKHNSSFPNIYISNNHSSFEALSCNEPETKNLETQTCDTKTTIISPNTTPLSTPNHCHSFHSGSPQFLDNNYICNENDTPSMEPNSLENHTSNIHISAFNRSSAKLLATFPSQTALPETQCHLTTNTHLNANNTLFPLENISNTNKQDSTNLKTITISSPDHLKKNVVSPILNHSIHTQSPIHFWSHASPLNEKTLLSVKSHDVKLVNPKLQGSFKQTPPTAVLKLDSRRRLNENTTYFSLDKKTESSSNGKNPNFVTKHYDLLQNLPCTTTHSALMSLNNKTNKQLELTRKFQINDIKSCGIHETESTLPENNSSHEPYFSCNASNLVPSSPEIKKQSDTFIKTKMINFENCSSSFSKDRKISNNNLESTKIPHVDSSYNALPLNMTITNSSDLPFVNLKIPPLLSHSGFYPVDLTRIEPSIQEPAPLPAGNSKNRRLMFKKRPSWYSVGKRLLPSPPINEIAESHETLHDSILQTTNVANHTCHETTLTEEQNPLQQWNHSPQIGSHHSNTASPLVTDVTFHQKIQQSPAKDTSIIETSYDIINNEINLCNKNSHPLPICSQYKNTVKSMGRKKKRNTYPLITSVSSCQIASTSNLWNCFESKCIPQDQEIKNDNDQIHSSLDSLHVQETEKDSLKEDFVENTLHENPCENFFETTPKSLGNVESTENVNFFQHGNNLEPIKESYTSSEMNLSDQEKNHNVHENVSGKRKETQHPISTSPGILPTPRPIPRIQGKKKSKNLMKSNGHRVKDNSNFSNILLPKHNKENIDISNNPDYRLDLVPVSPEQFVSLCDLAYDDTLKKITDIPSNEKKQNMRLSLRSFGCQAVTYSNKNATDKTKLSKRTINTKKKKFSLQNSVLTCEDPLVYFPLNQLPKEYINRNRQSLEISSKAKPTVKSLNYCDISQSRPKRIRQRPLRWWLLEHVEYNRPVGSECPVPIGVHRRPQEAFVKLSKNTKKIRLTIADAQQGTNNVSSHTKKTLPLNKPIETKKKKKKKSVNKQDLCKSPKEQECLVNEALRDTLVAQVVPKDNGEMTTKDSTKLNETVKKKFIRPKQSQDIKLIEYDSLEFVKIESNSGCFHVAIVLETPLYSVCELMLYPGQSKGVDVTISTLLGHVVMVEDTLDSNIESSEPCSGNCLLQIGAQACSMPWQKACATAKEMTHSLSEKKKKKNSQSISDSEFVLKSLSDEGVTNSSGINSVEHLCLLLSRGHHFHIPAETQYNFTNISKYLYKLDTKT